MNEGNNRADDNTDGPFSGVGDYVGPVNYVVTGLADTHDHTDDASVRSIRDAIDLANTTAGPQEIWLPAWKFGLTRQRITAANLAELDIGQGDLEIEESLTIRGVNGTTSVAWRTGAAADKVFELLGDYNNDGVTDVAPADVDTADYIVWRDTQNSTTDLRADGNDNGIIDNADYLLWRAKFGYFLMLHGITT